MGGVDVGHIGSVFIVHFSHKVTMLVTMLALLPHVQTAETETCRHGPPQSLRYDFKPYYAITPRNSASPLGRCTKFTVEAVRLAEVRDAPHREHHAAVKARAKPEAGGWWIVHMMMMERASATRP